VADIAVQLRDALHDRYLLERELGRGGMATVYRARDLKHDRLVALKVLHPELAAALGSERFLREIRTAARLQHPHILPVHDSGDAAGQLWFTMPYVEGESLRERLQREQQLPLEDALRIATEAARALEYAHHHEVVHRDIKPENLLLAADGSTLVADFGIARALGGAVEPLTETGLVMGTPAYMSPEQASGERELDGRTDQYSLACVVYEMLAGEPPYTGPSSQAIIAKRLCEPIPRLGTVRQVPQAVEAAVSKGLAKAPADRYPSTSAFAAALTRSGLTPTTALPTSIGVPRRIRPPIRLLVGLLAVVVALSVGIQRLASTPTLRETGALGTRDPVVLADFVNRTPDSTLAATLTDAFRVDLGQSDAVQLADPTQVASTLSQMRRSTEGPLAPDLAREVAQRQGIKAVVTGEVGAAGMGYVLSAAVVSAADGHTLTAVRTTAPDDRHLITALDELSGRLRERIGESVARVHATPPLEQVTTGSLEALRKYSAAFRAGWEAGDFDRAIALLRDATAIDTTFASGYRLMAIAIGNTRGARSAQVDAITRAYLHQDRLSEYERLTLTAVYQLFVESDLERAVTTQRILREEDRTADDAALLGSMLRLAGRCGEADSLFDIAIDSLPRMGVPYGNKLTCALEQGRIMEAESTLSRLALAVPQHPALGLSRAYVFTSRGELDSAVSILAKWRRDQAADQSVQTRGSWLQARLSEGRGRIVEAERYLQEYMAASEERGLPADRLLGAVKLAELELRYRRRADRAIATVQDALRRHPLDSLPPLDRPYLTLAEFFAAAGRTGDARRLVADYERVVPQGLRRGQSALEAAVASALALAQHRPSDAITAARAWNLGLAINADSRIDASAAPHCRTCGLYELGQAFEEEGQPDSALAAYRRLVDAPGIWNLLSAHAIAPAWRRLGELYEARGQRTEALDAHAQFAARWKNADPELQPAVREARQRITALTGEH
jgi:serine/threonine protein kinase/tetratricopeptide (TPR) repeat protein